MEIQRLNMDNSWLIRWGGLSIMLDPWLVGSEVDGFRWFNEQWHVTDPVPLADIGRTDIVLVSQPYSDHCHSETMRLLLYDQLLAVKPAKKRLQRENPSLKDIIVIPDATIEWLTIGSLQIGELIPDRWIDPIYHAIIIREGTEAILYAPHGFVLNETQLAAVRGLHFKLMITTFTYFKIPAILGGIVNPGMEAVKKLAAQTKPDHIVNTHDEQKKGKGLIVKIAEAVYTDTLDLSRQDKRIIHLDSYDKVTI